MWCACTNAHTHTHTHICILLRRIKESNNAIYNKMDIPIDYHTNWSKSDKDKYHISLIFGIWNMIEMKLFTKQKQTHRLRKQVVTKGEKGGV